MIGTAAAGAKAKVRTRSWTPLLLASLALCFAAIVAIQLSRSVPDISDRPLVEPGKGRPLSLRVTNETGDVLTRELDLTTSDPAALANLDEIRLVFGNYETTPRLLGGKLSLPGAQCEFTASPGTLQDNALVSFRRTVHCQNLAASNGRVLLSVRVRGASMREARLAVWGVDRPDARTRLLSFVDADRAVALTGRQVKVLTPHRVRRIELLAFMWNTSSLRLWAVVLFAAGMVVAGAAMLLRSGVLWNALSAGFLAAGLAMTYAVVVPPLQAPDEPDHLLSFAAVANRPEMAAATSTWAKRIHFDRIWHGVHDRFTPADRLAPYDRDWPAADVFAEDVTRRSTSTARLWQAVSSRAPHDPPHALLAFRVMNALLFGTAFAAGVSLISISGGAAFAAFCGPLLLIAPTLPFFGMHMSELAFSLAAVVLLACSIVVLLGDERTHWSGLAIGLATAFLAAGPRNMWPMAGVVGALLAGRAIVGGRDSTPIRSAAIFWGGFALPVVLLFGSRLLWVPSPYYEQWHLGSFDPRISIPHLIVVSAAAAIGLAGFVAEWLGMLARLRISTRAFALAARLAVAALAIWIVATLAWSVSHPMPRLEVVELGAPASAAQYVRQVLAPIATAARVTRFDLLTWSSLWGGFGWADAILPVWVIAAFTFAGAAAALSQTIGAARDSEGRRAGWIVLVTIGIVAAIAACAISAYGLHRNVHGRYLLGPYMAGVALLGSGIALQGRRPKAPGVRAFGLLTAMLAVHAYSLGFLLERYFG